MRSNGLPRQGCLSGLEATPPTDGILFGALLDDGMRASCNRAVRIARREGLFVGRLVPPDRLHVTLWHSLQHGVPPSAIELLRDAGRLLVAEPLLIVFDQVVVTDGQLILRSKEVVRMAHRLALRIDFALRQAGWMRGRRYRFTPHVTLGYGAGAPARSAVPAVQCVARGMTLIHSRHGERLHRHLATWPFGRDGSGENAALCTLADGTVPVPKAQPRTATQPALFPALAPPRAREEDSAANRA